MKTSKAFFLSSQELIYPAGEGMTRQFVAYNEEITTVKVIFEKGAIGAAHTHPHTQSTYVASGKFEVTIAGKKEILEAGDGFFVAPDLEHGVLCLEEGILIDTFTPCREDFIATIK